MIKKGFSRIVYFDTNAKLPRLSRINPGINSRISLESIENHPNALQLLKYHYTPAKVLPGNFFDVAGPPTYKSKWPKMAENGRKWPKKGA